MIILGCPWVVASCNGWSMSDVEAACEHIHKKELVDESEPEESGGVKRVPIRNCIGEML